MPDSLTPDAFTASLATSEPPPGLDTPLLALWHAARGDWTSAHDLANALEEPAVMWVHAHLHRIEGDLGNAGYWYRKAGRPVATGDLDEERGVILVALLGAS